MAGAKTKPSQYLAALVPVVAVLLLPVGAAQRARRNTMLEASREDWSDDKDCWNPGTWVPQIGPITQGPIFGTEYIGTLIGSPRLIYGRGFTMAIISNNIRDMFMRSIHV